MPLLGLSTFVGYLAWPHMQPPIASFWNAIPARSPTVSRAKNLGVGTKPKARIDPRTDQMLKDATRYAEVNIRVIYQSRDKPKSLKIQNLEVRLIENDNRRVPWLFQATAAISMAYDSEENRVHVHARSVIWKRVFQFLPDGHGGGECWREVTESRSGETARHHFDHSEWTKYFRSVVVARWTEAVQKHNEELRDEPQSTVAERQKKLTERKAGVAAILKITSEELEEIVEATD
jgi:hypothetical protein